MRPSFRDLPRALCLFIAEIIVLCARAPAWHHQLTHMLNRKDATNPKP
jgi:hypothetical protein